MAVRSVLPDGTEIAGYTIDGVLGRGGMATVYRARHAGRTEPVALKVIDPEHWDVERLERFQREAQLARAVVHRHILPIHDAGEDAGRPFVAMKLEQGDLAKLLAREGRLSPARVARLVWQIGSALDAAHAHGLVHRDVKASNVLLGEREGAEHAYVADFGIARAAFSGDLLTGELVGTVAYASPEQIRGEPVDHRTDVYGLGCLLYECLTGRPPFAQGSSLGTLWAHLHHAPPAPGLLVSGLPTALDAVVARALAKEPAARYQSAGAAAQALREAVGGLRPARVPVRTEPRALPSGTVTFLVSSIEGSSRLAHELGAEAYAELLESRRRAIREACIAEGGVEVEARGGTRFFAFASAPGALAAASMLEPTLAERPLRARVGLHTGTPHLTFEGYVGADVRRAARLAAAGHGGQVLVSQATHALLGDASALRPLGTHRLEDLEEPMTLYQLGDGSFPPLKTSARTNLPTPATTFVGREAELHDVDLLVGSARLLTITGAGGSGKTRFALELARRVREERFSDYEDGVFACFLAPLRDPSLTLSTIAQTLSVPEQPDEHALDALVAQLRERKLLLLLDNLEHLPECAPALAALVAACPGLTLLVTSRARLRVEGEETYELPPLAADEGVALFCERARVEPSAAIRELCSRLEGLPLAIELAAARMTLLSPEQLLERLGQRLDLLKGDRDADSRQQTLRAAIEWSYELLTPEEQRVFRALSVFRGGCTLEAAEAVAEADLDSLESLLDKSLLRRTGSEHGPRFWMLETIREYAAEQLALHGGDETRLRHAVYFAELVEPLAQQLERTGGGRPSELLRAEEDNVRAALTFAESCDRPDLALRLVAGAGYHWYMRGMLLEGRRWAERAVARRRGRDVLSARALVCAAALASAAGDLDVSETYAREALSILREHGEDVTLVLSGLGVLANQRGDPAEAERLFEESAVAARQAGNLFQLGIALGNIGDIALVQGDPERALARTDESYELLREVGSHQGASWSACNRAYCLVHLGRDDEALDAVAQTLDLADVEDVRVLFGCATVSAAVAARRGESETAARLIGAADGVGRRVGWAPSPVDRHLHEATSKALRAALGPDRYRAAVDSGRTLASEAVRDLLLQTARRPIPVGTP